MKSILISPHDDDAHLFAAMTCIREKPLVVVALDSFIQPNRGEIGCSAEERARETEAACAVTGNDVARLGLRDDDATEEQIADKLKRFDAEIVYAPALQRGNRHHDLVSRAARQVFPGKVREYTTYSSDELYTTGTLEIVPTEEESRLKNLALDCYTSQLAINRPHFDAVRGKSEWLMTGKKLQLGCGRNLKRDWINLDRHNYTQSDEFVQHDVLRGPLPFPDSSIDFAFSEDFLEHLPQHFAVPIINEIWRVLRPGGIMEHWVPNAGSANHFGSPTHLSHWTTQVFEHFDVDSYRWAKDREYEGFIGGFQKITAELVNWQTEPDGIRRAQSIHVKYRAVKSC